MASYGAVRARHRLFAATYLAASLGAAAVLLVDDRGEAASNLAFFAVWVALYVLTAIAWIRSRAPIHKSVAILLAFAGWVLLSATWSIRPAETATYGAALLANVLFVGWVRKRFELQAILRVSLATIFVLVLVGLALHALGVEAVRYVDDHGRTTLVGTQPIRGLFNHKITAGTYGVLAGIIAWYLTRGVVRTTLIVGLAGFVVLTGSTGALLLMVVAVAVVAFLGLARLTKSSAGVLATVTAAALGLGTVLLVAVVPAALRALGRDASLTGRTDLWTWGLKVAGERPVLGWGFFGYAGSERAALDASQIPRFVNYDLPHFHNSYLQGFVDLGVAGVLVPVLLAFAALFTHAQSGLRTGDPARLATTALVLTALAAGMGMHAFVQYNHFLTLSVFLAFAYVRIR